MLSCAHVMHVIHVMHMYMQSAPADAPGALDSLISCVE